MRTSVEKKNQQLFLSLHNGSQLQTCFKAIH